MRRILTKIYPFFCLLLLVAGFATVFAFAWEVGLTARIYSACGLVLGIILAPVVHELGHVFFAKISDMDLVYLKCFCIRITRSEGKKKFSFASPFEPDETQVLPKKGGNMLKRAKVYTIGGMAFGGAFLLLVFLISLCFTLFGTTNYILLGIVPYASYLFLLNLPPFEYELGKTDTLVYKGLKKGYDSEKTMVSAMEIQGQLAEGKSFSEIEEKYYFNLPVLCEDEPLFAVMLDLKYRFYLEKEEYEKAAACLNRLACLTAYLTPEETEKIAAELVYVHTLQGNMELAEESGKICKDYLKDNGVAQKRILAAYSARFGKEESTNILLLQAEEALSKEWIKGVAKFERILLDRIKERKFWE